MIKERVLVGLPLEFNDKIKIYPPKVKDVLENKKYSAYEMALTLSQEDLDDMFKDVKDDKGQPITPLTPLQYIIVNSAIDEDFNKIVYEAFEFFIHDKVVPVPEQMQILVGDVEKLIMEKGENISMEDLFFFDEENFFDFQNLVRQACGKEVVEKPDLNVHPKIRAMKAKARYRDKIKAKQSKITLADSMESICCMGIGISPLNIGELSYASLSMLTERFAAKQAYDSAIIQSTTFGIDVKKLKITNWLGNLNDDK